MQYIIHICLHGRIKTKMLKQLGLRDNRIELFTIKIVKNQLMVPGLNSFAYRLSDFPIETIPGWMTENDKYVHAGSISFDHPTTD